MSHIPASSHAAPLHPTGPATHLGGQSLWVWVENSAQVGDLHDKISLVIELNTNGVEVAAAAATGERKETVSRWLSLILQRCLCHHGREIGGLGLLVHTYASEGG